MSYPIFNLLLYNSIQARPPPFPRTLLAQILRPALQFLWQVELRDPPSLPDRRHRLLLLLFGAPFTIALLLQSDVWVISLIADHPGTGGANSREQWEEPRVREEL